MKHSSGKYSRRMTDCSVMQGLLYRLSEQGFRKTRSRGGPDLNRAVEGRNRGKSRGMQKNNKGIVKVDTDGEERDAERCGEAAASLFCVT